MIHRFLTHFFILILILSPLAFGVTLLDTGKSMTKRAIKEAENLTLLQDRLQACTGLFKAYKKAAKEDQLTIKERLFYFSKNFYTEKGFNLYLSGKELFEAAKYKEAAEKFAEADELEKHNIEVSHFLALAWLWQKKFKLATEANTQGLLINPLDDELVRDKLALDIAEENWETALETLGTLEHLIGGSAALSGQDIYFKALTLSNLKKKEEAKNLLLGTINKDKMYPESHLLLHELIADKMDKKHVMKYVELCKSKKLNFRDPALCARSVEFQ